MNHDHIFHQPQLQLQQLHHGQPSPPDNPQPQPQTNGHSRHQSLSLSPSKHIDSQQVVPQRVKSEPRDLDLDLLSGLPPTPEGKKLIVRLDLRKLGSLNGTLTPCPPTQTTSTDAIAGRKNSLRQPRRSEDAPRTTPDQNGPLSSEAMFKAPKLPHTTPEVISQVEVKVEPQMGTSLLTPSSETVERISSAETSSRRSSVSLDYSESQNMDVDDDGDYMDTGSQATKRRASSKTLPNPVAKKRTRSSVQGEAKKKDPPIPMKPPTPPPPVKKKSSPKPK